MADTSLLFEDAQWGKLGYIQYGVFKFPPMISSRIEIQPITDPSGRKRAASQLNIEVEFILVPGMIPTISGVGAYDYTNTTDDYFKNAREILQAPGQTLVISDKGFGDKTIFASKEEYLDSAGLVGRDMDVAGGPTPKVITWTPLTNKACKVKWICTTTITDCSIFNAAAYLTGLGFSIATHIDINGLTTRIINGSFDVPVTSHNNGLEYDTERKQIADDLFPRLTNYNRNHTFEVSEDRKSFNFSLIDKELPSAGNVYFPGLTKMDVDYTVGSSLSNGGLQAWQASLSANLEVGMGVSKLAAWTAINLIIDDLFTQAATGSYRSEQYPSASQVDEDGFTLLQGFSITDSMFGRGVRITAEWLLTTSLKNLIEGSGILQPLKNDYKIANSSWHEWRTYLTNHDVQTYKGYSGLENSDLEVTLSICDQGFTRPPMLPPLESEEDEPDEGDEASLPDPKKSWVHFENEIEIITDEGTSISYPVYDATGSAATGVQESGTDPLVTDITDTLINLDSANTHSGQTRVVTRKARPTSYQAVMRGSAIRVAYPPMAPELLSIGGVTAIKMEKDRYAKKIISNGTDANGTTQKVYASSWVKRYSLVSNPANDTMVITGTPANINT